jgi:hypothetical protein
MNKKSVMATQAVVLGYVLLLVTPLSARESTDVIVMKNGDHLTGEIKGLNDGVLYMSMQYILGTSSVQWSKVERLKSKQLFLVKTEYASVYTGTLKTSNIPGVRPVKIEVIETSGKEVVIDSSRIVEMDMTSAKFFQRFNGSINTGIIYSKGNQSTQLCAECRSAKPGSWPCRGQPSILPLQQNQWRPSRRPPAGHFRAGSREIQHKRDLLHQAQGQSVVECSTATGTTGPPNGLSGSDSGSSSGVSWTFGNG